LEPPAIDAHLIEQEIGSERVFAGSLLEVRRDRVRLPDGSVATREFVVHPGAALIVPVHDDGRLLLERQYRHPLRRVMLEFPAGKIDPGETSFATAVRELTEETGFTAHAWAPLGTLHPNVGYSTERIDVFLATGLKHVGARLDEGEFLDIVSLTEGELVAAFDRGEFSDGKSVAALFALQRHRANPR
jgi:ADP-ribose pyrophosphatase